VICENNTQIVIVDSSGSVINEFEQKKSKFILWNLFISLKNAR